MTREDGERMIKVSHRELQDIDENFQRAIHPLMLAKADLMTRAIPTRIRLFGENIPAQYEYSEDVKMRLAIYDNAIEEMVKIYKKKAM